MRFAELDNVIMSPHIGSGSMEHETPKYRTLDNIAAVLAGKEPSIRYGDGGGGRPRWVSLRSTHPTARASNGRMG
jgi:hypothetical protein